jgi:hypothetical protein
MIVDGCEAHIDRGLLTLVSSDSAAGFEVYYKGLGCWVPVELPSDELLVMVGYTLMTATAGALPACRHRVVSREGWGLGLAHFNWYAGLVSLNSMKNPCSSVLSNLFEKSLLDKTVRRLAIMSNLAISMSCQAHSFSAAILRSLCPG